MKLKKLFKTSLIVIGGLMVLAVFGAIVSRGQEINDSKKTADTVTQNVQEQKPEENESTKIVISNTVYKAGDYGSHEVLGEVKNNDSSKHSVSLKATFYDNNGKIMGTAIGTVSDIEPGITKTFNLLTMDKITGYKDMKVQVDTVI